MHETKTDSIYNPSDTCSALEKLHGENDKAINLYIDRCGKLLKTGIPETWDCVEKLDSN